MKKILMVRVGEEDYNRIEKLAKIYFSICKKKDKTKKRLKKLLFGYIIMNLYCDQVQAFFFLVETQFLLFALLLCVIFLILFDKFYFQ